MSADEKVAKDLVETLKDGQKGYATSADKLADSERPEWADTMRRFERQRMDFVQEIVAMGHDYGDDVDTDGSALAAVHRGWLTIKDALTGDKPTGVLDAIVQGEDHTVSEYDKGLKEDLSGGFREVVERQRGEISAARDEVKGLAEAAS